MKRLIKSIKNFVLLMVKQKNDVDNESFQGCDSKLKYDLVDVVKKHDEMFQEPKGLLQKEESNMKSNCCKILLFLKFACIGCQ